MSRKGKKIKKKYAHKGGLGLEPQVATLQLEIFLVHRKIILNV